MWVDAKNNSQSFVKLWKRHSYIPSGSPLLVSTHQRSLLILIFGFYLSFLQGVLLYGPPGTGKTLTARAVANRTDACFIRVIGSELVQKYVGEGARMVRELFQMARTKKVKAIPPFVLFS